MMRGSVAGGLVAGGFGVEACLGWTPLRFLAGLHGLGGSRSRVSAWTMWWVPPHTGPRNLRATAFGSLSAGASAAVSGLLQGLASGPGA